MPISRPPEPEQRALIPRGAGTKLDWGNKPEANDLILSTVRLNRVLEHASGGGWIDQYQRAALPKLQPRSCRHVLLRQHGDPVVERQPATLRDQRSGVFQYQLG